MLINKIHVNMLNKNLSRLVPVIKRELKEAKMLTANKQRKDELEKKYKQNIQILNAVGEGVYRVDLEGRITFINSAAAKIIGWEQEELIGRNQHDIIHHTKSDGTPYPKKECPIYAAFRDGEVHRINNEVFWRKDGSCFPVEYVITPIRDKNNILGGVVVTFQDITERIKLEAQLLQAQKMETVGQLAGGIAHDFNNILGAIINYGYILQNKLKNDEQKEILEHILDSTDKATRLTAELLAFSRKQILKTAPVKLNDIIKKAWKLLSRIIGEHIEIKTILAEKAPVAIVDGSQIEQVLMNLITNARDAMPEGGVLTIETGNIEIDDEYIRAHGYGEPGKYALLSISDSGTGMDKDTREKIFEPFFTTKVVGKGTGLGLAMVYGIIKQHNGYINVYSVPDEGTIFKIYLPITGEEAVEEVPSVSEIITKGTETVLLAEDDEKLRIATKQILEESGYKVIEAVNGEDAIEKFKKHKDRIQLLILDMVMPKKGGKMAYDEIRMESPYIKVLFMTGYTAETVMRNGILEERLAFISKPVSPKKLLKIIREIINK